MLLPPTLRRGAWLAAALAHASCGGLATGAAPGSGVDAASGSDLGDATAPGWSRQLGVYADCSYSDFGFVTGTGGALTLTQSSSGALTASYGSPDAGARESFTLTFSPTTGTSAALDPADQPIPWEALCWAGTIATDSGLPVDPAPTPITLVVASAALTYDADTVYLSVVGTSDVDATCEGRLAGSITCSRE